MKRIVHGETLEYWKDNAEEDYITTPISVLRYISILEEEDLKLKEIKQVAKNLIYEDFENAEYIRGICELIGELDGIEGVPLGDRAEQIAVELGADEDFITNMY